MSDLKEKWDFIKDRVRRECDLSDVSYNTWIEPLKLHSVDKNNVIIIIPSDQDNFLKYIENKFATFFKVFISEELNGDYNIVFKLSNADLKESVSDPVSNSKEFNMNFENANLDPRYRFENFIVGSNNKMAHAAALAVAETPATTYNPLYIYGGPGLGKTHLMYAIGNFILEHNPGKKVLYVTSENFTNEVIESVRSGNAAAITKVRDKYRKVDVLMVDDVQFIIGKEQTQEEFFHTFNALYPSKQIVLSSDKPPKKMETLEERFRSRFECGLITDIQPPDYETRMAILLKKAESSYYNINIDKEVIEYIATNVKSNIRELEGAFTKILAFAKLNKVEVNLQNAEEALRDVIYPDKPVNITPSYIISVVADHFDIKAESITSKKKTAEIALARQAAMYLCCEMTDYSLDNIGKALGGKDHTTVMYGRNKIAEMIKKDEDLNNKIEIIKSKISPN